MDVFMLWHVYERTDDLGGQDEEKLIGVFSSKAKAQEAIEQLKDREGFRNHPLSCFEIHRTKIDQISWADGFSTVRW